MAETIVEKSAPDASPELQTEIPTVSEKSTSGASRAEPAHEEASAPPTVSEPQAEPKKRGRPAGAKDRAPRRKKIAIVEEPLQPEPAPPVAKAPAPAAPRALPRLDVEFEPAPEEPRPPPPPSPRTVLREASRHILELKRLETSARKSHLFDMYSRGLHTL